MHGAASKAGQAHGCGAGQCRPHNTLIHPFEPTAHHCTGLKPGTKYFYRVAASPKGPWTKEYHFTTLKAARNFPMNLGYMADLGISFNASTAVRPTATRNKFTCGCAKGSVSSI